MNKSLLLFLSQQPDPRFVKKIRCLARYYDVSLFYFERPEIRYREYALPELCEAPQNLGPIVSRKYFRRIYYYLRQIRNIRARAKRNKYDYMLTNSADVAGFFLLCTAGLSHKTKRLLIISDLVPIHYERGLSNALLRQVEKLIFRSVSGLILTSKGFYQAYYHKVFAKDYFILENKPLEAMMPKRELVSKHYEKKEAPLVIGVVGLLYQVDMYKCLFKAVGSNPKYTIHVHGQDVLGEVDPLVRQHDNIVFFGEYDYESDIEEIYKNIDIVFCAYDTMKVVNNLYALPNKLYEAMFFQVPIMTNHNSYLASYVRDHGLGYSIDCHKPQEILSCLESVQETLHQVTEKMRSIEPSLYLGDRDYEDLAAYIDTV